MGSVSVGRTKQLNEKPHRVARAPVSARPSLDCTADDGTGHRLCVQLHPLQNQLQNQRITYKILMSVFR